MDRSTQLLLLMACYAVPVIVALVYRIKNSFKKQKL